MFARYISLVDSLTTQKAAVEAGWKPALPVSGSALHEFETARERLVIPADVRSIHFPGRFTNNSKSSRRSRLEAGAPSQRQRSPRVRNGARTIGNPSRCSLDTFP